MSVKISTQTSQLVTSSGSQTLDDLLGGGYTVGSMNCLCASPSLTYANVLLKYFISQGLAAEKVRCLVVQSIYEEENNLSSLVFEPVKEDSASDNPSKSKDESKMKIAWRYENLPRINQSSGSSQSSLINNRPSNVSSSSKSGSSFRPGALRSRMQQVSIGSPSATAEMKEIYCNSFDMQKCINDSTLNHMLETGRLQICRSGGDLTELLATIREFIESTPVDQYCRIAIQGFGSVLFEEQDDDEEENVSASERLRFLVLLKQLLRSSGRSVCLVSQMNQNCHQLQKHLFDTVFALKTHSSTDQSYFGKEYTGILNVEKLPRINRVCVPRMIVQGVPVGNDFRFGFKCRKRKFALHRLCLPPEIGDDQTTGSSCSSSAKQEPISRNQGASISLSKKSSSTSRPNVTDW